MQLHRQKACEKEKNLETIKEIKGKNETQLTKDRHK